MIKRAVKPGRPLAGGGIFGMPLLFSDYPADNYRHYFGRTLLPDRLKT